MIVPKNPTDEHPEYDPGQTFLDILDAQSRLTQAAEDYARTYDQIPDCTAEQWDATCNAARLLAVRPFWNRNRPRPTAPPEPAPPYHGLRVLQGGAS